MFDAFQKLSLTSTSLSATFTGFPESFSIWLPATWKITESTQVICVRKQRIRVKCRRQRPATSYRVTRLRQTFCDTFSAPRVHDDMSEVWHTESALPTRKNTMTMDTLKPCTGWLINKTSLQRVPSLHRVAALSLFLSFFGEKQPVLLRFSCSRCVSLQGCALKVHNLQHQTRRSWTAR